MVELLFCRSIDLIAKVKADSLEAGAGSEPAAQAQNGGSAQYLHEWHSEYAVQRQKHGEDRDSDGCKSKKPQHLLSPADYFLSRFRLVSASGQAGISLMAFSYHSFAGPDFF